VIAVQQHLDEIAVPLERDRRPALLGDRRRSLPVAAQRGATLHPGRVRELVPPGLQPGEPDEQADGQPEEPCPGIVEEEPHESRSLDLDLLGIGALAILEQGDQ
jgi:hypothetical protein